jgi:hypothetical protein
MSNDNVLDIQIPAELPQGPTVDTLIRSLEIEDDVCQPGDKECVKRMIQAFSDCE